MNKRKWLLIALAAICVSILAYGTTAFFTAEGQADNVITTGNVAIELIEKGENDEPFPSEGVFGVMPGNTVTKVVSVQNTGSNECWVRVKVEKDIDTNDGSEGNPELLLIEFSEDWELDEDGWYRYKKKLSPKDAEDGSDFTTPLFESVTFDPQMGNEYQNSQATVTVKAQAVQCAHNGDTVTEAKGWPEEAAETPETPEETTLAPDIIA